MRWAVVRGFTVFGVTHLLLNCHIKDRLSINISSTTHKRKDPQGKVSDFFSHVLWIFLKISTLCFKGWPR